MKSANSETLKYDQSLGRPSRTIHLRSSIIPPRAFTLIELLVVIGIIAVLTAILLPALSWARQQARGVVCRSHIKQWGTTLALYLEDQEGHMPYDNEPLPGLAFLRGLKLYDLYDTGTDPNTLKRSHAVLTDGIVTCPTATRTIKESTYGYQILHGGELNLHVKGGGTFYAWDIIVPTPSFNGSYGFNQNLLMPFMFDRSMPFNPFSMMGGKEPRGVNVYSLKHTERFPLLLDATLPSHVMFDTKKPSETEPGELQGGFCINRHNGTVNALFLDYSVRSVGLKELWTLKWSMDFNTANEWTKAGGAKPENWPKWLRRFKDY